MSVASSGSISSRMSESFLVGCRLEQGELELGVDLLEGLGGGLEVQHLEDRRPVGLVELLYDVGDVRRMELVRASGT